MQLRCTEGPAKGLPARRATVHRLCPLLGFCACACIRTISGTHHLWGCALCVCGREQRLLVCATSPEHCVEVPPCASAQAVAAWRCRRAATAQAGTGEGGRRREGLLLAPQTLLLQSHWCRRPARLHQPALGDLSFLHAATLCAMVGEDTDFKLALWLQASRELSHYFKHLQPDEGEGRGGICVCVCALGGPRLPSVMLCDWVCLWLCSALRTKQEKAVWVCRGSEGGWVCGCEAVWVRGCGVLRTQQRGCLSLWM